MLTLFEVGHAIPAFLFIYAGCRTLFNHETGIYTIVLIAVVILIATTVHSRLHKQHQADSLTQRIAEQSPATVTKNLQRVRSFEKPSLQDANFFLKTGLAAPELPFCSHKNTVLVDCTARLEQFKEVLLFSEPRYVGVDIEHSKNHSYFGLICLI